MPVFKCKINIKIRTYGCIFLAGRLSSGLLLCDNGFGRKGVVCGERISRVIWKRTFRKIGGKVCSAAFSAVACSFAKLRTHTKDKYPLRMRMIVVERRSKEVQRSEALRNCGHIRTISIFLGYIRKSSRT